MTSFTAAWPRTQRRAASRKLARQYAFYNGPTPRHEPARSTPTCLAHHRKLPCKRCASGHSGDAAPPNAVQRVATA